MTAAPALDPSARQESRPAGRRRARLPLGLLACLLLLLGICALSLVVGAKGIAPHTVFDALFHHDATDPDHLVVMDKRLPRTIVGVVAGICLGASGAVIQGVTRNPLADPGILGINAGAALSVVVAISVFGITSPAGYLPFAFVGATVTSVGVYLIAATGREGATPVKLALAGAALSAVLVSIISAVLLTDTSVMDNLRFWQVGALAGRGSTVIVAVLPTAVVGAVLALALGRSLNGLAMGEDVARALGQRVALSRGLGAVAVVLLAGSATAAVGPIAFVGLAVPHAARRITGPDYRWIVPYSALLGPILLLGCDVLGRVIARPGEVQVGIVTAFVGAPIFIALVRRRTLAAL